MWVPTIGIAKEISEPSLLKAILESLVRSFVFLPDNLRGLFKKPISISLAEGNEGAWVNVSRSQIYIPREWVIGTVDTHEVIATVSHEIGHLIYAFYLRSLAERGLIESYELSHDNALYQMLRPFGEVFADTLAVMATGRPDAISSIMPEDSPDRILRDFRGEDFGSQVARIRLALAFKEAGIMDVDFGDVHIKSYLRTVIWRNLLELELPPQNSAEGSYLDLVLQKNEPDQESSSKVMRRVLEALSPLRWRSLIQRNPPVPGLLALAASLALKVESQEISFDTLASQSLEALSEPKFLKVILTESASFQFLLNLILSSLL